MTEKTHDETALNLDNVRLLVTALRSGKYARGIGALVRQDWDGNFEYCPLGVACEVAGIRKQKISIHPHEGVLSYNDEEQFLPNSAMNFYGFKSYDPYLENETGVGMNISKWNDQNEANFDDIANMLEAKYLTQKEQLK